MDAIKDHPDYLIDQEGRIFSVRSGRYMKPENLPTGHLRITFSKDKVNTRCLIHRLVLEAYVGPCPPDHECCHKNDIPWDNRLPNLYWGTKSQNGVDASKNGRNPNRKLSDDDVRKIRRKLETRRKGLLDEVAYEFGVSKSALHDIVAGRTFFWMP